MNPSQLIREQHKLRNLAIKIFFSHINNTIDNLDQSLLVALDAIKQQQELNPKLQNCRDQHSLIAQELTVLVEELRNAPAIWIRMLKQNDIDQQGNKIKLNGLITITEVYQQIIENVTQKVKLKRMHPTKQQKQNANIGVFSIGSMLNIKGNMNHEFNFQECYCDQNVCNLFATVLNYYAKQLVYNYEVGKAYLIQQTQKIEQLIKKCQIMNSYILFTLLKQMSRWSYAKIKENFESTFVKASCKVADEFCRYAQTYYQVVHLHYSFDEESRILTIKERNKIVEDRNMKFISLICQNQLIQLSGVAQKQVKYIQDQTAKNLIIELIDKDRNKSQKVKKWKIVDIKDSISEVYKIIKGNVEDSITGSTDKVIQNDLLSFGVPQSATLGGSLGKCLVDIDQYKDVNDFFVDLSKTAMIGGSIMILLEQVPIFNYFIIAGGLSYTVYRSYKDEITSSIKKMKQIGKASIVAVGSVGATVTGMMIGQIAIPIPFLGAFIGGMIGGYIGQKGSRQITSVLTNKSFLKVINFLRQTIIDDQYWNYSSELLQRLGISKKYFEQSICQDNSQRDIKMTILCFCIVCYYESRKQIDFTQKKLKQKHDSESKPSKNAEIVLKQEEFFQNQFNIVLIAEFLSKKSVYLANQLQGFQGATLRVVS